MRRSGEYIQRPGSVTRLTQLFRSASLFAVSSECGQGLPFSQGLALVSPGCDAALRMRAAFQTTRGMRETTHWWEGPYPSFLSSPGARALVTSVRCLIAMAKKDTCVRTSGTAQKPGLHCRGTEGQAGVFLFSRK